MVAAFGAMGSEQGQDTVMVRLRVSHAGKFVQGDGGAWRYLGGDHFLESVPETTRYADLMFSLAEKVDGAVSVKYQLPGEELDPDSLISVNDDNDIKELFHEYQRALRLPGTPIKTFRLRLFLFPAAEDPFTPEDIAYFSTSHTSSADKLGRDAAAVGAAASAAAGAPPSSKDGSSLARAFARVASTGTAGVATAGAHTRTPSSFSSELSCSSAPDGAGGSADGTATPSAADTELAWEAGFRAGQEAAARAAEEWQALVAKRMQYLGHVQSDYILSAADAAADHAWPETASGAASPWDHPHSVHMGGSSMFASRGTAGRNGSAGVGALDALDDIDFDPDAEEAAEAAAEAAAAARAQAFAVASLPVSRHPSPRTQALSSSAAASPPPPPAMLHHPQPLVAQAAVPLAPPLGHAPSRSPPRVPHHHHPSSLMDSQLVPETSVVMEDVENDVEFQSMFESKYSAGAGLAQARRSPSAPPGGSATRSGGSGAGPATQLAAAMGGSSVMLASAGTSPPMSAAVPIKQPPGSGSGSGAAAIAVAAAAAVLGSTAASPKSLLPTHISVFGDGVTGLDLQHATAVGRPAVQLPSHISEFGGEEECSGEDAEQCRNRDANTMSVMKAALPDDDDLLADAMDALRRSPFPPDAVQLPTSFELLGGGAAAAAAVAAAAGVVSPRRSPQAEGGLAAAAAGGGGLVEVGAGALPTGPSQMHRSPSLEDLLSKVQRIDAAQVTVLAKIGEGAFGEVSLAQCPTYGRVAVKWIKPTKVERHWASFWHEAELMSRLNHPNVLRFFGLVVDGPMVVGIMTEFAAAGSLAQYLRSGVGFIPLKQRAQLALHAVNGMAYLHSLKVVHFDVKPDNLLVDGDWLSDHGPMVKVADFGLSKHKYNTFCSNVHDLRGTLPYMAPEMIMDHTHVTEKADVWSLGVVFWEMLTLEVPFADMPPAQLIGALGLGRLRLTIPEWCEPDWRALMESCWVEDPTLRPSCRQLATHLERIRDMAP